MFDENEEGSKSDIDAGEENISSGSLAEASSSSSNNARNKRPPVLMRDYVIGEVFFEKKMMKLSHVYPY